MHDYAHAAAVAEAELPPLTERPPPQADRPHLDRRLPRRPAVRLRHRRGQRRRRPDGQGARAVPAAAGRRHQLADLRRRGRCPHRRQDLRRDRPPEDDHRPGGHVLRRRAVRRLLARASRSWWPAGSFSGSRSGAPRRWCRSTLRSWRRTRSADRSPAATSWRSSSASSLAFVVNAILGATLGHVEGVWRIMFGSLRAARDRPVLRHAADARVAALARREGPR